jgi:hypothetical protein
MRQYWGFIPIVCLATVLLAGGIKIGSGARPQSSRQSPTFTPFVLSEQETHFSRSNVAVKSVGYTIARREDGSLVRSFIIKDTDSPDGTEGRAVFIWDVPSRKNIMLEPFTKSAMTQLRSPKEIADFLSSEKACSDAILSANSDRSTEQLLDHAVVRVEEASDILHTVSWVAPDLDCFPLRQTVALLDSKHLGLHHDTIVTKIEIGEPPSSMFDVPQDYTERSPLEIQTEYARKSGGRQFWGTTADDAERQYRQHQDH